MYTKNIFESSISEFLIMVFLFRINKIIPMSNINPFYFNKKAVRNINTEHEHKYIIEDNAKVIV